MFEGCLYRSKFDWEYVISNVGILSSIYRNQPININSRSQTESLPSHIANLLFTNSLSNPMLNIQNHFCDFSCFLQILQYDIGLRTFRITNIWTSHSGKNFSSSLINTEEMSVPSIIDFLVYTFRLAPLMHILPICAKCLHYDLQFLFFAINNIISLSAWQ